MYKMYKRYLAHECGHERKCVNVCVCVHNINSTLRRLKHADILSSQYSKAGSYNAKNMNTNKWLQVEKSQ